MSMYVLIFPEINRVTFEILIFLVGCLNTASLQTI